MLFNILLFVVIILVSFILITYNNFVKLGNGVREAESGIDVLLKQRFDLIPNIVESVKGYSNHENDTLTDLTRLRSNYQRNNELNLKEADELNNKINSVLAIAENYPELKANQSFLDLQDNLNEIENKLQYARNIYNSRVKNYNNKVESVPSDLIAKMFSFKTKEFFKLEEPAQRENIKMNFNN